MSIRKRNWTTAKGVEKEAWIVDYADGNGTRRLKTFARKKDADAFAASTTVEIRHGTHVADSATVSVPEAGELWLRACTAAGLERSTVDAYEQHLRLHINPLLGAMKLNRLTVPVVRDFQEQMQRTGRSPAMVKRVTVSLGSLLNDALERGLAARNAVHEMSKRRGKANKVEKRQKARLRYGVDIPTMAEVRAILEASAGRYRPFIITAVFTGMRASELRGLTWADVDFDKGKIHVRQRADKFHVIGMPKTDAGQRSIPLTPLVTNTLREWRLACPRGELNLVFPNGEGNVEWHQNIIKRGWLPTLSRAGIAGRYSGLHALRHWFASWCINSKADGGLGLSPKAVQQRMGHSGIQITFDTYGHLFPAADEAQALADAETRLFSVSAT